MPVDPIQQQINNINRRVAELQIQIDIINTKIVKCPVHKHKYANCNMHFEHADAIETTNINED